MDVPPDVNPLGEPAIPRARPAWTTPDELAPPVLARPIAQRGPLELPLSKGLAVLDVGLIIGVLLITMIAPAIVFIAIDPSETLLRSPEIGLATTVTFGLVVAALAIVVHRYRSVPMAALGVQSHSIGLDVAIGLGAFVACLVSRMMINMVLITLSEEFLNSLVDTGQRLQQTFPKLSVYQAFAIATLVGTYEETVFRGFVLPRVRRLTGSWWTAILASSIVFMLLHFYQGVAGMAMVFMLSIVLSIIFVWRQSLLPCIIAHAVTDFVSLVLLSHMGDISVLTDEGAAP